MQQSLFGSLLALAEPQTHGETLDQILETALAEATFMVIDLETTGLNAKKNAITELTAIHYENGKEKGKYSTLVKPTEPISLEVQNITGITDDMVQNAPSIITVLSELCSFAGPSPLIVGHNIAFDLRFIREKLQQSGLSSFLDRFDISRAFCTKVLAQKTLLGLPSYEGIVVATHCGIVNPNPHRAENDVRMSAGILFALIERLQAQQQTLRTVQDLLNYQGLLKLD